MAASISVPSSVRVMDLKGKIIAPGFIDMHVHLREPGTSIRRPFSRGATAAAAGDSLQSAAIAEHRSGDRRRNRDQIHPEQARVALDGLVDVYPIAAVDRQSER